MVEIIDAIYEKGFFKPLENINLPVGQKVKLIIETEDEESVHDILKLATTTGLHEEPEKVILDRKDFFFSESE